MNQNEQVLIPIPLPTEVPEPPSLEKLPLAVIHSATVEMLIQQNEDLSARLKVNIRRNSVQEQEILTLKKEISELQRIAANLKGQNEIIKEKEAIWYAQKEAKNRKMEAFDRELQLMELRYNELYTTAQQRQRELRQEIIDKTNVIQQKTKKNLMLKSLIARGKDKFREFLLATGANVQQAVHSKNQLRGENNLYKKHIDELKARNAKREKFLKDKLFELSELSKSHIHTLEKKLRDCDKEIQIRDEKIATAEQIYHANLEQELSSERARQRELEIKIEDLKNLLSKEGNSRLQVQKLANEITEVQNEKIAALRIIEDEKERIAIDNNRLADVNSRLRNDNAALSTQLFESKKVLESIEKRLVTVTRDNEELEKELTSVKKLWIDIQSKYEKELVKAQSLTKLNRQLAVDTLTSKVERSIGEANPPPPPSRNATDHSPRLATKELSEKITHIFASQYSSMANKRDLDL